MAKVGRNEPCPCGSGKKYKHCCLERDQIGEAADRAMLAHNEAPVGEFHGFSPIDMAALLYRPLDAPHLVRFPEVLDQEPQTPVTTLALGVINAIGDGKLKTTAKGNLPAKLCKQLAEEYRPWAFHEFELDYVHKEEDFRELHGVRNLLQLGDFMQLDRGGFRLNRKSHDLLERGGARALYPALLEAWATRFNWGYFDLYPELAHIQAGWVYSLYLLQQYGDGEHTSAFFEDQFMTAFPALVQECKADLDEMDEFGADSVDDEVERYIRNAYCVRTLERFAHFFGLARLTFDEGGRLRILEPYRVQALPLLADAVRWQVAPSGDVTVH